LHQLAGIALALAAGGGTLLLLTLTLAAAEALTRQAFPWHIDWWKYWRYRGTRAVAGRVGAGYAVAAFGFAWVTVFYLVTRGVFGWWVPSELIDDPNLVATRLPWIGAIGLSLQAAVSEEALFRAVPLSLIALWAGDRKDRDRWMAAGVIATALLFGFAHSDYPSWPPYSRGVEIFLEACVWGVLFLRFGILVPVIAHFVYDLVLFGLFASTGSDVQYRVSAVVLVLALLAPALSVFWAMWRQRGWAPLGSDAWFQGWQPGPGTAVPAQSGEAAAPSARIRVKSRLIAPIIGTLALIGAVASPAPRRAGPDFVAPATRVWGVADSRLRARGLDPAQWRRLSSTARDTLGDFRRFLRRHGAESVAVARSGDYAIPAWWIIRYVRPDAPLEQRVEEWRVRVLPDGRPFDLRHVIPEAARRDSIAPDSARRLAMFALDSVRIDTAKLRELEFVETPRPGRRDASIAYVDTSVVLPDAATARVSVTFAGDEVLSIRREIRLPEPFVRQSRSDGQKAMAFSGLLALPAIALLIVGMVRSRRRPMVATDDLSRRWLLVMLIVFALTSAASSLQALPAALALYDTAVPWRTFLVSAVGTQAVSLVGVFVVAAFWVLANRMRRRAGIPLVAGHTAAGGVSDDLAAALVLGGVPALTRSVGRLMQADGVPSAPATTLDALAPVLTRALEVVPNAIAMLLAVSIPALALTLLAQRRAARLAGVAAFLGFAAAAFVAVRMTGEPNVSIIRQVVPLGGGALIVLAIAAVGRMSVLSWLLGALFLTALGSVSFALHAPTGIERLGGLLAALLAAMLIVAGNALSRRTASWTA
jgi:membrane protease YdiL (CAAX protease family)